MGTTAQDYSKKDLDAKDHFKRALMTTVAGFVCVGGLALSVTPANAAVAAASKDSKDEIQEIVVTGKKIMSQQRAPESVTAVTGESLSAKNGGDIRDLVGSVPNLFIENIPGYNAASIGIRGASTGDIILSFDPAVGVMVDGLVLAHVQSQMIDSFDVKQVEVYRGPQGTLFGRNTTGGVIYVSTIRPGDKLGGKVSLRGSNFSGRRAQFGVDVPINQTLKFRVAGTYEKSDGYYINDKTCGACSPNLPTRVGDGARLGGTDVFFGRAKLLWQPSSNYEAFLEGELLDDKSQTPPVVNESGPRSLFARIGFPGIGPDQNPFHTGMSYRNDGLHILDGHRVKARGVTLDQKVKLDSLTLSSLTAYRWQLSELPSSFAGEAFQSLYDVNRSDRRTIFQEEVRAASDFSGPVNFVSGVFYYNTKFKSHSMPYFGFLTVAGADPAGNTDPTYQGASQDQESWAIYADGTYKITKELTLTLGARQTWEKKSFMRFTGARMSEFGLTGNNFIQDKFFVVPLSTYATVPHGFVFENDHKWNKPTFRGGLDYLVNPDVMTYFMYSQGFKSGGYNEQCKSANSCLPFNQEQADSFEVGFKSEMLEHRVRLNGAAFHVTYNDIQRDQVVQFIDSRGNVNQETKTTNAGKMTMWGLEAEFALLPFKGMNISGSASYLHSKYNNFMTDLNGDNVNDDASFLKPTRSPEWIFGLNASYTQELPQGDTIRYAVNGNYQSESEFMTLNNPNTQVQARTLVNGSITYTRPDDSFSVTGYMRNIFDVTHRVAGNAVGNVWTFTQYGPPREYGMELTVNF